MISTTTPHQKTSKQAPTPDEGRTTQEQDSGYVVEWQLLPLHEPEGRAPRRSVDWLGRLVIG